MRVFSRPQFACLATIACLAAAPASAQSVVYVDDDAAPGGDGASWATAFRYLQDAVSAANANPDHTEIRVAGGVYAVDQDEAGLVTPGDPEERFVLNEPASIAGGYNGLALGDDGQRDLTRFESVITGLIDGGSAKTAIEAVILEENALFELDGLTIERFTAPGTSSDAVVRVEAPTVRLRDLFTLLNEGKSVITADATGEQGVTAERCISALNSGGSEALRLSGPHVTIADSILDAGFAPSIYGLDLGIVHDAVLTVSGCEFSGFPYTIRTYGGAGGTLRVADSVFSAGLYGVYMLHSSPSVPSLVLEGCEFLNTSIYAGSVAGFTMTDCTMRGTSNGISVSTRGDAPTIPPIEFTGCQFSNVTSSTREFIALRCVKPVLFDNCMFSNIRRNIVGLTSPNDYPPLSENAKPLTVTNCLLYNIYCGNVIQTTGALTVTESEFYDVGCKAALHTTGPLRAENLYFRTGSFTDGAIVGGDDETIVRDSYFAQNSGSSLIRATGQSRDLGTLTIDQCYFSRNQCSGAAANIPMVVLATTFAENIYPTIPDISANGPSLLAVNVLVQRNADEPNTGPWLEASPTTAVDLYAIASERPENTPQARRFRTVFDPNLTKFVIRNHDYFAVVSNPVASDIGYSIDPPFALDYSGWPRVFTTTGVCLPDPGAVEAVGDAGQGLCFPCPADLTSTPKPGDPAYGQPDGIVDGSDLSYYVERWLAQDEAADITTTNTNPGELRHRLPDGQVDGADLSVYVEAWLGGCP